VSTTSAGILFLVSLIVALVAVHVPLGDYMYRVYTSNKDLRGERVIYRLIGADPKAEQTWGAYARSVLAFSAISILFLFILQLVQGKLPLHLNDPATQMTPALAWNTAVSFVTNTNWQAYSGESTQGHLVQMAGLAVQNFVSAAVGMAVLDEIEQRNLRDNVTSVGTALKAALTQRKGASDTIGDVRGHGLFIGVEMVKRPDSAPDVFLARQVINRLKDKGFLTSNAGAHANVVKIRPPLPFSQADAAEFLLAWDDTIAELAA